ncbi:hypothetical protein KY318_03795, partial [Candidatus Woesearchaeota archaeon]|nr:hypothetical protein [Candidatus Woesearchaeota archaeon]
MKYQLSTFNSETRYYTRHLAKHRGKSMLIVVPRFTKESFLAIAPLSRAAHELGKDVKVVIPNGNSKALEVLEDVWACYEDLKRGKTNPQTKALARFIKLVSKKIEHFEEIFKRPSIIVYATPQGFKLEEQYLQYKHQWFKPYRRNALRKTCRLVWDKVFALKQSEVVDCKFELVPTRERLELPLEDYLNNFAIMLAMVGTCPGKPRLSSATPRASQLAKPERVSELIATLSGCELDKDIPDPVFKAYKKLSELLGLARLKPGDAIFAISGKGYY